MSKSIDFAMHDGGDGVEEGQMLLAGGPRDRRAERIAR